MAKLKRNKFMERALDNEHIDVYMVACEEDGLTSVEEVLKAVKYKLETMDDSMDFYEVSETKKRAFRKWANNIIKEMEDFLSSNQPIPVFDTWNNVNVKGFYDYPSIKGLGRAIIQDYEHGTKIYHDKTTDRFVFYFGPLANQPDIIIQMDVKQILDTYMLCFNKAYCWSQIHENLVTVFNSKIKNMEPINDLNLFESEIRRLKEYCKSIRYTNDYFLYMELEE